VLVTAAMFASACGRLHFNDLPGDANGDGITADAPGCGVKQIAAGKQFTCEIDRNGAVWCWGNNDFGKVQPGGTSTVATAQQVILPEPATQISAGRDDACARLASGNVWCWGSSGIGQLGGATGPGPAQVPLGAETAIEVHVGGKQVCIRRTSDQAVECWGGNENFALGNTGGAVQGPTVVAGTAGSVQLSVGHHGSCILDASGNDLCWGANRAGELASGGGDSATPVMIAGIPASMRVARTGQNGCAIDTGGDVRCWGQGASGQVGDGNFIAQSTPSAVVDSGAVDVQNVPFGAWVQHGDGTLSAWGIVSIDGEQWQLGTARASTLTGVTQLSAGYSHTCALVGGNPICWGRNDSGELGRGTIGRALTLVDVPLTNVDRLSIVDRTVCARSSLKLYCWGLGANAQLGNGVGQSSMTPLEVTTGLSTVDGVAAGWIHACASGAGQVACWGQNNNGQLGDGTMTPSTVVGKAPVLAAFGTASGVITGFDHTCAISGTNVQCVGANYYGQLGNGNNNTSLAPVNVTGITSPNVLSGKFQSVCALASGTPYCWGWNGYGQLGDGTTNNHSTPVIPSIPSAVADIKAAQNHTCALLTNGDVYCWGANIAGEVGQGDNNQRNTPTKVTLPAAADLIVTGYFVSCARIMTTSDVYCWGNAGLVASLTPAVVPALHGATALAIENGSGCAIFGTSLKCWGEQLLLGTGDASVWMPMIATVGCMP
jgi:alpha-tubulin suppressor-like RCC1 family protein